MTLATWIIMGAGLILAALILAAIAYVDDEACQPEWTYWHPGEAKPTETPANCQMFAAGRWWQNRDDVSTWRALPRRWRA